jgi:RimJ/RimL family protein N-acetyltransferase
MEIRHWQPGDTSSFIENSGSDTHFANLTDEYLLSLQSNSEIIVAVTDSGVIGIAGLSELYHDRIVLWAMLTPTTGRHMLAIHRAVRAKLATLPQQRIEATVDVNFPTGAHWLLMLGFTFEGTLRRYLRGMDQHMFSIVR